MSDKQTYSGGIGVSGLLGVLFIALKLLGLTAVASWSWWWVLAPFWIPASLAGVFLVIVLGVMALGFFATIFGAAVGGKQLRKGGW